MYYIYGLVLEKVDQTKKTHFISLRANINQTSFTGQFYIKWNPQVYYLNMDGMDGFYIAQSLSQAYKKVPVSVSTKE